MPLLAVGTQTLFLALLACWGGGAVLALITARWPNLCRVLLATLRGLGGLAALALGLNGLLAVPLRIALTTPLPGLSFELTLTRLGAFFVLLMGLIVVPTALYAYDAARAYADRPARLAALGAGSNLLALASTLLPLASNAPTFLALWQLLILAVVGLIIAADAPSALPSAAWTLALLQGAALCLLLAFLLLGRWTGSLDFAVWLQAQLGELERGLAFVLLTAGFGVQAGVLPAQRWLVGAVAALPGHIAALLYAGVMQLGIYGLLLAGFVLLANGPLWWAAALLLLAAGTATSGVVRALGERDLARFLGWVMQQQQGVALLLLAAGLLLPAGAAAPAASLALVALFVHTLVHACALSLLLLGLDVVRQTTQTTRIAQLGGLLKALPWTGSLCLVAVLSLAGLPPLGGFVALWLTWHTFLALLQAALPLLQLLGLLGLGLLALLAGLSCALWLRAFGLSFLGLPRSSALLAAVERGWAWRSAMLGLALITGGLALLPPLLVLLPGYIAADLLGTPAPRCGWAGECRLAGVSLGWLDPSGGSGVSALWLAVLLLGGIMLLWLALRLARSQPRQPAALWRDGWPAPLEPGVQPFADPLAQPLALLTLAERPPYPPGVDQPPVSSASARRALTAALALPLNRTRMQLAQWLGLLPSAPAITPGLALLLLVLLLLLLA